MDKTKVNKPFVLRSDNIIYFDVDETLIFWKHITYRGVDPNTIDIPDPYMRPAGAIVRAVPNQRNIDLLKRNKGQGRSVVVWSAGGYAWAESVVKTLGLEEYVDLIIPKPSVYVDDRPMEDWKLNRIYLSKDLPEHI